MNYAQIRKFDISNGPGVRASIFVSGCRHGCDGCFNKEYWGFDSGQKYTWKTKKEMLKNISDDKVVGLSILGGEPFQQDDDGLIDLCSLINFTKSLGKTVWVWTGYTIEELKAKDDILINFILKRIDVLVDGKFEKDKKDLNLKYCGSTNQKVIYLRGDI